MRGPGQTALGTWSGGRFMRFGEAIEPERLEALLRPGDGPTGDAPVHTLLTADVYGVGGADSLAGRAIAGVDRSSFCLTGAVGHDFYEGDRDGPKGFPRFTDPALRGPEGYADYLRMATERSLERLGTDRFDLLMLHNPDRIGYSSDEVWEAMRTIRDEGLAGSLGVAPGPANGFTLDLISCLERFGDEIDWAMIILNPLEPWPGEFVLPACEANDVSVITRVVDYGGLFWDDLVPGAELAEGDHRSHRPEGWVEAGRERIESIRPIAEAADLTLMQAACDWCLSHPAVKSVVPTLIQEAGPDARPIEDKRRELAALPAERRLSEANCAEIRRIGDNVGCMALKGASPAHDGPERPDAWPLDDELRGVAERWEIDPASDLAMTAASAGAGT